MCAGGVEGDVDIAMGVRWMGCRGECFAVMHWDNSFPFVNNTIYIYVHVYKNIYVCEKNTVYVHLICVWYVTL